MYLPWCYLTQVRLDFLYLHLSVEISIATYCTVTTSEVYRDCVLEVFGVRFPIDLIPITIRYVYMIAEMDWLIRFGALIDCENQLVTIHDPSGGVLSIHGEGTRAGSTFCSATRARQFLQHGCMGYLVYMVDTLVEREKFVSDVPIMM